jgi:O-antigen/teichoic acid export membrane protein
LVSLAFRSILVFFLAKFLQVSDIGIYGLLSSGVAFAVYPLGFDFYTYSTRSILRSDRAQWRSHLRSQVAFGALVYSLGIPALLLFFITGLIPWSLAPWFYLLVPLEHVGIEIDRLLIAMGDQSGASIGIFIRQALMPTVILPMFVLFPETRNLRVALAAWVLFDLCGVAAGFRFVRRDTRRSPKGKVNWTWIRRGIGTSVPFLIGTLCLRALFTMDRQVVGVLTSLEVVGAYTLFAAVGAGINSVVNIGVYQFLYPEVVKAISNHDGPAFQAAARSMILRTVVVTAGISLVVLALIPTLLSFVGSAAYSESAWMLPWILGGSLLYNLSLTAHYTLYALDADRLILFITIAALVAFVGVVFALSAWRPVLSVLIGLVTAQSVLLIGKGLFALRRLRIARARWNAGDSRKGH